MERTNCDCKLCQVPCRTMAGYLVPDDIVTYMTVTNYFSDFTYAATEVDLNSMLPWAEKFLLASDGVFAHAPSLSGGETEGLEGHHIKIPMLVPNVRPPSSGKMEGACIHYFVDPPLSQNDASKTDGVCMIHAHSPYGCRMFDAHLPAEDASVRARKGMVSILEAWRKALSDDVDLDGESDEMTVEEGIYVGLWMRLRQSGKAARPAAELRREAIAMLAKYGY